MLPYPDEGSPDSGKLIIIRKVKLAMVTRTLDKQGRRTNEVQYLERPVHKLVLIQEGDREFPDGEPSQDKH